MFTFNSYVSGSGAPKTRYKYDKGDYVNMSEFQKIDWDEFLGQKDIDSQWSSFREKLSEASEKYIPKIIINKDNKTKKRHNLPIKTNTKAKIKRKQRLWNNYLQTGEERYKPDFYGDLVYRLKKIVGSNNFSAQFIKIISHYKKIGYNINVLQQTACLVVNPITVGNFAFLFNCTPVGRTSDSMMVPT